MLAEVLYFISIALLGFVVLGAVMSATNYVLYFRLVSTIGATKSISVEFAVTAIATAIAHATKTATVRRKRSITRWTPACHRPTRKELTLAAQSGGRPCRTISF